MGFRQPSRLVDRARPRGPAGVRGAVPKGLVGQATVPVGGCGAWPGFEIDHSEPQARVWRSRERAAAHGRTKGLRVKKCVRNRGFSRIDL